MGQASAGGIPGDHRSAARALFRALRASPRVLITSEPSPDGDAIGAEIALYHVAWHAHALEAQGEPVPAAKRSIVVANEHGCPDRYRFLLGAGHIRDEAQLVEEDRFDLAVVVDGGVERTGSMEERFRASGRTAYVDHHRFGSRFDYDLRLYDAAATSTTQLAWAFFTDPDIGTPLDQEAAEALYLGLVYDTGSFQYPLTTPRSHRIAATLIETGFDFPRLHERVMLERSFAEVLTHSAVLANARRSPDGRVAWATTTQEALRVSEGDYAPIIQTLSFVEGAEAAFCLIEQASGPVKVTLRSRGKVDVGAVARQLTESGGGHRRAAGCELEGTVEAVRNAVLGALTRGLDAGAGPV